MPPVTLHIGLSKTGTTACQHTFDRRRADLLALGLLYPRAGVEAHHHFGLAESLLSGRKRPAAERQAILAAYTAEVEAATLPLLVSSEHFSDASDADIGAIASFFGPETAVVLTLRNQIDWSSAMYAETIRWGFRMTFEEFLRKSRNTLNFEPLLRRWENAFGRERLHIIPYDTHATDIVGAVLRVAGLSPEAAATIATGERVHPSLSAPFVQLQYELSEDSKIAHLMEKGLWQTEQTFRRAGMPLPKTWRIPNSFLLPLLQLDEANDRIAQRYGLPRPLFGQPLHDMVERNHRNGYAAATFADWLLGLRASPA